MEGSEPETTHLEISHDLHKHAANGDTQMVISILSNNDSEELLHNEGPRQNTPLHLANGDTQMVISILSNNDSEELLHRKGPRQNTPLHLAILYRHKDTAKALVQRGASLTMLNACGDMPISYCCDGEMLKTLLSNTSLHNQEPREVKSLGQTTNIDTGAVDATGKSILHYASLHLKKTKSRYLFSQLISMARSEHLLLEDKDGATFLGTAAKEGNKTAILALKRSIDFIETEVQKKLINGEVGITALMHGKRDFFDKLVALSKVSPAKVKITLADLLKKINEVALQKLKDDTRKLEKEETKNVTMNINSMEQELDMPGSMEQELDMPGSTEKELEMPGSMEQELRMLGDPDGLPTYLALYAEKDEVFEFLLESGLLTENQWDEKHKRTCLHWAVVHKRADIVEKLVKFPHLRPSPSIKDAKGRTALQIAFEDNNQEAMELLRGRPPFKESEDKLFRDREVYVQVLNAILVGAALIGSVTFAGWLQLPSQTAFEKAQMKIFWVSNGVSFYSAVAAMCVTIAALLPTPTKYVGVIVNQVRVELVFAAFFFAISLGAVTTAFASAGFSAIPTSNKMTYYQKLMSSSTIPGAAAAAVTLLIFMVRLFTDVLSQEIRLFIKCIPYINSLPYEIRDISRCTYTNANLGTQLNTDIVALHDTAYDTLPSQRRKELKSLGFQFSNSTHTPSYRLERSPTKIHNVHPATT